MHQALGGTRVFGILGGDERRDAADHDLREDCARSCRCGPARAYQARRRGGYKKPERKTLAVFLEQWLRDVAKPSVRPSTYRSYEGIVRNHLTPALGHIQLMKLTPPLVARALSGDEDAGAARTRQLAYIVLRSALDVAVKWTSQTST